VPGKHLADHTGLEPAKLRMPERAAQNIERHTNYGFPCELDPDIEESKPEVSYGGGAPKLQTALGRFCRDMLQGLSGLLQPRLHKLWKR
jgi:hypothetical protein